MITPRALLMPITLTLIVSGCAPTIAQPVPSTTPSSLAAGDASSHEAGHGWLVSAKDNYVSGTARLCAEDTIWTDPDDEVAGIYVEENGGMPDGYGDQMWEVDPHGLRLQFNTGKYYMNYFDGDINAGIGTLYTFEGTFEFTTNDEGVPISGSGTGTGDIVHESGDIDHDVPDSMSFTFSPIPEPDWCTG